MQTVKKTMLSLAILTLLTLIIAGAQFTEISSANFFPDPGPDLPRIYIRANGNVEPATAPIERSGDVYKLTGNIAMHTIVIQRDNIVLDGSGYLIEGNKSWTGLAPSWGDAGNNGIISTGRNNVNITNLNIERFSSGVRISGSSNISIVENRFNEEAAVFDSPMGIVAEASSYVLIENNNFTSINGPAIACNGTNITITRNTLTDIADSVDGCIALQGSSNTITNNFIQTASPSIRLGSAYSSIIARNHITGSLAFVSASNNQIFQNNLTGIRLIFSSNNTFFGNNMTNNLVYDTVALDQGTVNNTFYANTFQTNCTIRIQDAGATFWDNGTIGNYWADYNGTDSNGDGIGDSPYIITAVKWDTTVGGDVSFVAGQDNYPLMAPYNVENGAIVLPQAESFLAIIVAIAVAVAVIVSAILLVLYNRKRQRLG
jgi:parallel beta-helix repeat protein